jgi:hypothetical protein
MVYSLTSTINSKKTLQVSKTCEVSLSCRSEKEIGLTEIHASASVDVLQSESRFSCAQRISDKEEIKEIFA